ncbi:MAG: type II and III secretion system protein [Magnetococcales bacterium]|nr:type II and III secretion system protein [Magnetococcales bacterium]
MSRFVLFLVLGLTVAACQQIPSAPHTTPSEHHLKSSTTVKEAGTQPPAHVAVTPILPPPQLESGPERYTVVVHNVPVRELLFTLARDAHINVDIHPAIDGDVTLNALEQTLPQILERISNQVDLRYELSGNNLMILPDLPFWRTYQIDYLNLTRTATSTISVEGDIGDSGDTGGNSRGTITNTMSNDFWEPLIEGIENIIEVEENMREWLETRSQSLAKLIEPVVLPETTAGAMTYKTGETDSTKKASTETKEEQTRVEVISQFSPVIAHEASGVISVYCSEKQHEKVEAFVHQVVGSAQKQVLIEATVVEVTLSRDFETGVDWQRVMDGNTGTTVSSGMMGGNLTSDPVFSLVYTASTAGGHFIEAELKALEQFGDVRVLSSPKIMALNNQAAVLKIVDQRVYFNVEIEEETNDETNVTTKTTTIESNTVPVGLVMIVMPQISANDIITLDIRPSLTRLLGYADAPTVDGVDVDYQVPEIQVREMETILRVADNQMIIMGGLMNDEVSEDNSNVPILGDLPVLGELFSYDKRSVQKTEMAIFLRPTVTTPSGGKRQVKVFDGLLDKFTETREHPVTFPSINIGDWKSMESPATQTGNP